MVVEPPLLHRLTGLTSCRPALRPAPLVYSPHAYKHGQSRLRSYEDLKQAYDARQPASAPCQPAVPLWVGEFGTCQTLDAARVRPGSPSLSVIEGERPLLELTAAERRPIQRRRPKYDAVETYGLLAPGLPPDRRAKIVELLRTVEASAPR